MSSDMHIYAIVLADGSGQRFWPLSRELNPKQLLSMFGTESLIAQAVHRILPFTNGGSAPVNLGAGWEISIKDYAETIATHVGYVGGIVWDTTKPNGQPRRKLDVGHAKKRFGFGATVPFDEGIRRAVEWWGADSEGYDEWNAVSALTTGPQRVNRTP